MWLVKFALRNPYTVGVFAALIFLLGGMATLSMKVDILPVIDIPVVNVLWNYPGLPAVDMENRVVFQAERGYSTTVDSIQRIESQSIPGIGLIRVFLEPGTDVAAAISQISSSSATTIRIMPPAIQPPNILKFNASNVPVSQLTLSSDSVPEEQLFDYVQNFVRMKLFTLPGLSTPAPYGGKNRQINVDVRPELLSAKGLSSQEVVTALGSSNLVIPAGSARIGSLEYSVLLNSSPKNVDEFKALPIKSFGGRTVTLGEVARVDDSFADPTSVVRINGKRATFLNILKKAEASTLDVVNELKDALHEIQAAAPMGMKFSIDFDQSVFVRASMWSVITEALIAAALVSLMILFFLGSWKSVFIVCTSIPLSILTSILCLKLTGQTLNIMTLGGLSLAIGMLVDDATVEVENIDRNRKTEASLTLAILRAASQVALPAIMSTLSICVVFSPIILLTGPARYLFVPMALSVVFAMIASYVLSRTLVPTLSLMMLGGEKKESGVVHLRDHHSKGGALRRRLARLDRWRRKSFERMEARYKGMLEFLLQEKKPIFIGLGVLLLVSLTLPLFVIGRDFFPQTDAGIMKMHFRARPGLRIEQTEKVVAQVEERIRKVIPAEELKTINSLVGVPLFLNLAFVPTDNIGPMDAEIQIGLSEHHKKSTAAYQTLLREEITKAFPGSSLYFQPADIMNMVLNFGQSSTIDVQVESKDVKQALGYAQKLRDKMRVIPGAVDVHISQVFDYPSLKVTVDRERASRIGLTQKDVASNMLISLSSSSLYAPSFFLNPENNVTYGVVAKVPLAKISSTDDLLRTPITPAAGSDWDPGGGNAADSSSIAPGQNDLRQAPTASLGNLSQVETTTTTAQSNHVNVQRVVDVMAGVENRDLGGVATDIRKAIKDLGELPPGVKVSLKGQSDVMDTAFPRLGLGLILAILLVYLLMVVLFQSWLDPFIVLTSLPGAAIGILWMLAVTGTTINVVSLMGSIMAVGIAVSNAILMVSFANELRVEKNLDSYGAALAAGETRLRPVLMTALAMILGMLPMSLGLGEAGAQNAPLGRAVIGGLLVATLVTLFVVPLVYASLRKQMPQKLAIQQRIRKSEKQFDEEIAEAQKMPGEMNSKATGKSK